MPKEQGLLAGTTGGRWLIAYRDISEHIVGSPPAHMVLVHDAQADLILSFGVEASVDEAVAAAFERIQNPASAGPRVLVCDSHVISNVRLNRARFDPPPIVAEAMNADLRAMTALFDDFLATGPAGKAHSQAVSSLEEPARRFAASKCWRHRADSEPLLLDASIDGERAGGIVSVMGNGGDAWGVCIFPDGDAFKTVMDRDKPGMPPDGVLSCVLDRRALRKTTHSAVEMAARIHHGQAEPARGREVQLLHVALIAAAEAPPVGQADPVSGTISAPDFDASYVVFDIEGAERQLRTKRSAAASTRAASKPRVSPSVRFGVLPREAADAVVSADDELPRSLLEALPAGEGVPAVYLGYETRSAARSFVQAVEAGRYLGVSAELTPVGTTLRLIGLSDPIPLGIVGTNWPPLRGFMGRRERSGGLHALVVASLKTKDLEGIFICVLPQLAEPRPQSPSRSPRSPRSKSSAAHPPAAAARRRRH